MISARTLTLLTTGLTSYPAFASTSASLAAFPPNESSTSTASATHRSLRSHSEPLLSNGAIWVELGPRAPRYIALHAGELFEIRHDQALLRFANGQVVETAVLPPPRLTVFSPTEAVYRFTGGNDGALELNISYTLHPSPAAFVTKSMTLRWMDGRSLKVNITDVVIFNGTRMCAIGLDGHVCMKPNASHIARSHYGLKGYALFQRWNATSTASQPAVGAVFTADNPYLDPLLVGSLGEVTLGSVDEPLIEWRATVNSGPLHLPVGFIGLHQLKGRRLPPPADPIDEAEQEAMLSILRLHSGIGELYAQQPPVKYAPSAIAGRSSSWSVETMHNASRPRFTTKINIAWTENDFQLDIATAAGRAEYQRIIDRAAQLGISHILFAPRNSDVSSKANNTDAWGWEQLLWFGMGQQLRLGLWRPGDPLPASLREMLAYFASRGVRPVAYVYPILAFLAHTLPGGASPEWIVEGTYWLYDSGGRRPPLHLGNAPGKGEVNGPLRASLADPSFQQWLAKTLVDFASSTGAGGFSFDYTYFELRPPVASQFSQWAGWRSILQAVARAGCNGSPCVLDSRQQNHAWGPWMWVAGKSYAEPLMSDEQPASWKFYEPDLHTDRLAANRQREVAWDYRMKEFCPAEALPGFAFHQTDRTGSPAQKAVCPDARCAYKSRRRDFDLLGYRYSLLSSIGTAGLNNVLNNLPARSEDEFSGFPDEDIQWISSWLRWTDTNAHILLNARPLVMTASSGMVTSRPSRGNVDGMIMLEDGELGRGFVFVFNPSHRPVHVQIALDESNGFKCSTTMPLDVTRIGSSERNEPSSTGGFRLGRIECGGRVPIQVMPTSAAVFSIEPAGGVTRTPHVYGTPYDSAVVNTSNGMLSIRGAVGEVGTKLELRVLLPPETPSIGSIELNGMKVPSSAFECCAPFQGVPSVRVYSLIWAGEPFARCEEIHLSGGSGAFLVPTEVRTQLQARNATYHIEYDLDPQGNDDANVAWLAPGRLLLFFKPAAGIANEEAPAYNLSAVVDGAPLLVRAAYNTIVPNSGSFIGHWADVTRYIDGDTHTLQVVLPHGRNLEGVFFENVETTWSMGLLPSKSDGAATFHVFSPAVLADFRPLVAL